MNSNTNNPNKTSVIAASVGSRGGGPYKAVMVKRGADGLKLVWKATEDDKAVDLASFVAKVMPSVSPEANGSAPAGVLGIGGAGVAFYRLEVPPVADSQLKSIVSMQAESLLPLSADQMQMTWRASEPDDGKRLCSIAAARNDRLRKYTADAGENVSRIMLNAEAVVTAWMNLFGGDTEKTVLINMGSGDCRVLLVDEGRLAHAITFETGEDDLTADPSQSGYELFVHDLRNAIELFGADVSYQTRLLVISENDSQHEKLVSYLNHSGFNAASTVPSAGSFRYAQSTGPDDECGLAIVDDAASDGAVTESDICEYIEPIGLALMATDAQSVGFDLFSGLRGDAESKKKAGPLAKLQIAALVTVVLAVVCVAVDHHINKAALAEFSNIEIIKLIENQKTRELIASHRPDVLGVLNEINQCGSSGMMLDSFDYKAGKITIASFAKTREQIYEFEKKIKGIKNLTEVQILSPVYDEKQKRVNFKLQCKYVNPFGK